MARLDDIEKKQDIMEKKIEELSVNSHPPVEFSEKLNHLHNKIDSIIDAPAGEDGCFTCQQLGDKIDAIYTLYKDLSDSLNNLKYSGEVYFGNPHHMTRTNKMVEVDLHRDLKKKI
jgi:hypothetical protein